MKGRTLKTKASKTSKYFIEHPSDPDLIYKLVIHEGKLYISGLIGNSQISVNKDMFGGLIIDIHKKGVRIS